MTIGQAGEFDYSGSQAIKVRAREQGSKGNKGTREQGSKGTKGAREQEGEFKQGGKKFKRNYQKRKKMI